MNPVNIDVEFAKAVVAAGGEVVEDLIPESERSHKEENADYLFREYGVVAELKRLERNSITDPNFQENLRKLYSEMMDRGELPLILGKQTINLRQIAEYNEAAAIRFIEPYKQRLGKLIQKVSGQIRKSATYFGVKDPKGLLIFAADGDLGYELALMEMLLFRLLSNQDRYRGINSVLYFSANVTVNIPGVHNDTRFWIPYEMPGRSPVTAELTDRLGQAWLQRMAAATGIPIEWRQVPPDVDVDISNTTFNDSGPTKLGNVGG